MIAYSSIVNMEITCFNDNEVEKIRPLLLFEQNQISTKKNGYLVKNIEGVYLLGNDNISYILGLSGIYDDIISFTMLSNENCPMDYILKYDSDSDCYYGTRYEISSDGIEHCGFVRAIIQGESLDNIGILYDLINLYGHNNIYINNSKIAAQLIKNNRPTILNYYPSYEFMSSKLYFNGRSKVKVNAQFTN